MADIMSRTSSDWLQMLSHMDRLFGREGFDQDEGTLALDMYEQADEVVVEASVPGFTREDIDVQLHQGVLSIVASRPAQRDGAESDRRYYRRERPVGSWTRRIALPGIVHDADVDAEMKDGVLKLRIPIPAAAKPRRIAIRTSATPQAISGQNGSAQARITAGDGEHTAPEPAGAALN